MKIRLRENCMISNNTVLLPVRYHGQQRARFLATAGSYEIAAHARTGTKRALCQDVAGIHVTGSALRLFVFDGSQKSGHVLSRGLVRSGLAYCGFYPPLAQETYLAPAIAEILRRQRTLRGFGIAATVGTYGVVTAEGNCMFTRIGDGRAYTNTDGVIANLFDDNFLGESGSVRVPISNISIPLYLNFRNAVPTSIETDAYMSSVEYPCGVECSMGDLAKNDYAIITSDWLSRVLKLSINPVNQRMVDVNGVDDLQLLLAPAKNALEVIEILLATAQSRIANGRVADGSTLLVPQDDDQSIVVVRRIR